MVYHTILTIAACAIQEDLVVYPSYIQNFEVKWKSLSRLQLFVTPWIVQSMEFTPEYLGG